MLKRLLLATTLSLTLLFSYSPAGEGIVPYKYEPVPQFDFKTIIPLGSVNPSPSPTPTPKPTPRPTPKPTVRPKPIIVKPSKPSGLVIRGTASYYDSWCNCTAMTDQRWRGMLVWIKGPTGTVRVRITDAGPVPSLHRVADLNTAVFIAVCGSLSRGLCTVSIWKA